MKLYLHYLSLHIKSQMQYRLSFWLTLLAQFVFSFFSFLSVWYLLARFHGVEGFSADEILLCYGINLIPFSLAELFFRGFDLFDRMLGNGEFDRILVRPRSLIPQVLGAKLELTRLGRFLQAVVVFLYALCRCEILWTPDRILTLLAMLAGGTAVFAALFILSAALSFFTTQGLEVLNIFIYGGREFGQYPLSAYGKWILRFFTWIIPLALFQYYPLLYLTGRSDHPLLIVLPLVAALFLIPCLALWSFGVRKYKSTGS